MEVRDPVHGSILINKPDLDIIKNPFFQRLRRIKQLGFSEYVFPGATHTRYLHSIGVMHVAQMAFDKIFNHLDQESELKRLKHTLRLAALLHDTGHAPLSHTTEFVMPCVSKLGLPIFFGGDNTRQATHEDYTIKAIIDSNLSDSFKEYNKQFGVEPLQVAELIIGKTNSPEYFTYKGKNYFPLLHQLVSSEMDCDRMDYLLRDSYFCGVSYGKFDLDWILDNLKMAPVGDDIYLGISQRAVSTFDDFLLCRFHMFMMVYFHYKSVCLEKMLKRYFKSSNEEYKISHKLDEYLTHDDSLLMRVLKNSQNEWAQRIIHNDIPTKAYEIFGQSDLNKLHDLTNYLDKNQIDYIHCSSQGRLSKYYNQTEGQFDLFSLKVLKENKISNFTQIIDIHEATDLFSKFSKSHIVNRVHLDLDLIPQTHLRKIKEIIH